MASKSKYVFENIKSKNINGMMKKTFDIINKDKKKININNIKNLLETIENEQKAKTKKNVKVTILGLNDLGIRTLKGANESFEDLIERHEEYLGGKVSDYTKFNNFYRLQVSITIQ
jgi:hypothetical protein